MKKPPVYSTKDGKLYIKPSELFRSSRFIEDIEKAVKFFETHKTK